jgi:hypothetical protein
LVHSLGGDVRGRAGDAAGGELKFSRVHRQPQSRLCSIRASAHSTARTAPSKV